MKIGRNMCIRPSFSGKNLNQTQDIKTPANISYTKNRNLKINKIKENNSKRNQIQNKHICFTKERAIRTQLHLYGIKYNKSLINYASPLSHLKGRGLLKKTPSKLKRTQSGGFFYINKTQLASRFTPSKNFGFPYQLSKYKFLLKKEDLFVTNTSYNKINKWNALYSKSQYIETPDSISKNYNEITGNDNKTYINPIYNKISNYHIRKMKLPKQTFDNVAGLYIIPSKKQLIKKQYKNSLSSYSNFFLKTSESNNKNIEKQKTNNENKDKDKSQEDLFNIYITINKKNH